jgi:radical SAM protein with 4Fe4S-binding SPASM domain
MNFTKNINHSSATPCDGASFSMYITCDMFALPCSFDNQQKKYAVSLNEFTVEQAWRSEQFENFRNWHKYGCKNCKNQNDCRSGCPIVPEINLCQREEKEYYEK